MPCPQQPSTKTRAGTAIAAVLAAALTLAPTPGAADDALFLRPAVEAAAGGIADGPGRDGAPVEIDPRRLAANPAGLSFDWPVGGITRATRVGFEERSHGLFWRGRLHDGGDVLLTLRAGRVAGFFFTADGSYSLEPRGGATYRLRRIDIDGVEICAGALPARPTPAESRRARGGRKTSAPRASTARRAEPTPRIDILILHTAATREAVGGKAALEATLQSWVDVGNVAFETSEIDARLRLAAIAPVPVDPSNETNSADLLRSLRRDRDVRALRDAAGADYVSLVYERSRGACGRAFVMRDPGPGFADSAVSVVQRACGNPITFIHELGHVLGAHHHPEDGGEGAFPYSFGHWSDEEGRQTAMSSRLGCCPQQPYFSNPRVAVDGFRTGIEGERDNARTFRQTAPIVAAFGERPCDLDPGDPDFCAECGPCAAGEGDCDGDGECASDLECVRRAGKELGFSRKTDVCLPAAPADCPVEVGHPDYCARCGPCERGEGDCDSNPECAGGLTCQGDAGAAFGLGPDVDVCVVALPGPTNCSLNLEPGDPLYCLACGPCQLGEGDCSQDQDCASFLTCVDGVGAEHGFDADIGVCRFPAADESCPVELGHRAYCRKCGPCDEGDGGCKRDRHCADGLVCDRTVGPDFGFGRKIGVCVAPGSG